MFYFYECLLFYLSLLFLLPIHHHYCSFKVKPKAQNPFQPYLIIIFISNFQRYLLNVVCINCTHQGYCTCYDWGYMDVR